MPQKPQTAPLPFSGVPQQGQIPVQAPAIPPPQPPAQPASVQIQQPVYNPNEALAEGTARDQALAAQAQQLYPDQSSASILATLSGIAGNVAGALTGRGDVGASAVQYGDNLREQAGQKQRQFMARVTEEEQKYKQQQKELTDLQNRQLRANSMVPLINRVGDTAVKTSLYTQLAAGDVDGAQQALGQYQEMQRQRELDVFNREQKTLMNDMSVQRLDLAKQRAEMDEKLKEITYAQKVRNFAEQPKKEQEKIVGRETREYNAATAKIKAPVQGYVSIAQQLGDLDGPEAREKLSRILGVGGSLRGSTKFGSDEDRKLFQDLQRLFAVVKTEDFGASFTEGEKQLFAAGAGLNVGTGIFNNALKDPNNVINGLRAIERELGAKLDAAGANKQDRTIEGFEKGGNFLTLRTFTKAIADAAATGPVNLDRVPEGVKPELWMQLNRSKRAEFMRAARGK